MSKKLVSLSGDLTKDLVFLYSIIIAATISEEMPYARRILPIFPYESEASEKSTKSKAAWRLFLSDALDNSPYGQDLSKVDLFLRNSFWFLWNTFSTSGCALLRSSEL